MVNLYRNDVDEGCLSRVLKTDQRELHLLFPEKASKPVENPIDQGQHCN